MARRSFSLLLAWRYLNPRRAMLSAVTIISVTGVLLGVLVLVVVMAVYAGMERDVKQRLLGFSPHVLLEQSSFGGFREPIEDWRPIADEVTKLPGVASATAYVEDYVLMVDETGRKRAVYFQAIDGEDPSQVKGIHDILDHTDHPASSADMGLDDRIVVSSIIANQFGLQVGDKVKFLSSQNLDEIERIDRVTSRPPVREEFADQLAAVKETLETGFTKKPSGLWLSGENYEKIYLPLFDIYGKDLREPELEIVARFLGLFSEAEEEEDGIIVPESLPQDAAAVLAELDQTDVEKMDAEIFKTLKQIVLPKEATVIGVYLATQMAFSPDVFMPLPLSQELAGLKDGVLGISVRLDDAYQAVQIAGDLRATLPETWQTTTWITKMASFSRLIQQQRVMMYFALSFIMLVSAFSMMAVMFTVTIQKRREIGVMKALGAAPGQIVRVFVNQGMILGFVGSILGVLLGLLVLRYRGLLQEALRAFGFDPFSKDLIASDILPCHIDPLEIVIIAFSAFVLCSFAAFVPAWFAARSDAAKSLRNL